MEKLAFSIDGKRDGVPSTTPSSVFLFLSLIPLSFPNSGLLARHPKNKDIRRI